MEQYLAPAVMVALAGLILQGIKAALDLHDRAVSRTFAQRQGNIALFVALVQIVEESGLTPGEALAVKRWLVRSLLADTLSDEILTVLKLSSE